MKSLITHLSLFSAAALTLQALPVSEPCPLGKYSINGRDCIDADPGFYVDSVGSRTQTPAAPGTYVAESGQSAAISAFPGSYVAEAGKTSAQIAEPGYYVPGPGATAPIAAAPGHFVFESGQTGSLQASLGKYVAGYAASSATQADPGYYVDTFGAATQTIAQPGTYVQSSGSSSATVADMGHYVSGYGASSQTAASPGHYIPTTGASAQTAALPGYYVPNSGASEPIPAPQGRYVPGFAADTSLVAPAGTYVDSEGAAYATPARPGYFVDQEGSTAETAAPSGFYTSDYGSTSATLNPPGTWSEIASPAARVASTTVEANGTTIVSPVFTSTVPYNQTFDLGHIATPISIGIEIGNSSEELSFPSNLTRLSLLGETVTDPSVSSTHTLPVVLEELGTTPLIYTFNQAGTGNYEVTIDIETDERAPFGASGSVFTYTFFYSTNPPLSLASFNSDNFTPSELENPSISGFEADPDNDGMENGLEYILGLNPRSNQSALNATYGPQSAVQTDPSGTDRWAVTFSLPTLTYDDVVITVEAIDSLESTSWDMLTSRAADGTTTGPGIVEINLNSATSRFDIVVFDTIVSPAAPNRFFRVRVTSAL